MFRFHQSRLQLKEKLGKGRFGTVFPYQKDPQDRKWVVKRIKAEDPDVLIASLPEVVLGFSCDHPRVVPVKGYFIEKDSDNVSYNIYMKLPRMKETLGNDFKERKRKSNPYQEHDIIQHFHSLVCGIEYLHSKKIYHGDVKPDNLLLDENNVLKIADVGIAKHVEDEDSYQTLPGQVGTYQYSAPEVLGEKATKETLPKADVWSIGVVILELCLFDFRMLNSSLPQEKLQNKLDELFRNLQGKYNSKLINLIERVLSLDPKKRPEIGEVRAELETNFSEILDEDLVHLGKSSLIQKETQPKTEVLNQHIKEISQQQEVERNQMKQKISQLELQQVEQKQQYESRIQILLDQEAKNQQEFAQLEADLKTISQKLTSNDTTLRSYEEQIQRLQQAKASFEQKSKDLEKYIETTVKNQMKTYEDQIKALQESQQRERIKFDQERDRLLKECETLQIKVKQFENLKNVEAKRESFGEDYEKNLQKVVLQLDEKFKQWFKFKAENNKLVISVSENLRQRLFGDGHDLTNEHVKKLSEDIVETLAENKLLNLLGLDFDFDRCYQLTDQALADMRTMISNQSLHLQHLTLNFDQCRQLTDQALAHVTTAISNQSLHLQHLTLNFSGCDKLTDQTLAYIATAISNQSLHLQNLALHFFGYWLCNPEFTDAGVETVATAIEKSCKNLQELNLDFSNGSEGGVTEQKKEALRTRFAHVPKLEIK